MHESKVSPEKAPRQSPQPGQKSRGGKAADLSPGSLLSLQRSAGNSAVNSMLAGGPVQRMDSEEAAQKWTALISRVPARWNGSADTWQAFKDDLTAAAARDGIAERAQTFLAEAEGRELASRFANLRVYDLTEDQGAKPDNLNDYTPMLFRLSTKHPTLVATEGWGPNVYSAIFPTSITPSPAQIKALLGRASQQSGTAFLYQYPLSSVDVNYYKYMGVADATLTESIPNWDSSTMKLVEVIAKEAPSIDQMNLWAGTWRPVSSLVKK